MTRRWLVYVGCGLAAIAFFALLADATPGWVVMVAATVLAAIAFAIHSALDFRDRWRTGGDDVRAATYRSVAGRAIFICIAALACGVAAIAIPFFPALPFAIAVEVVSLAVAIAGIVNARRYPRPYRAVDSLRLEPDAIVPAAAAEPVAVEPVAVEPPTEPEDSGRSVEDDEEERFRMGQQGY